MKGAYRLPVERVRPPFDHDVPLGGRSRAASEESARDQLRLARREELSPDVEIDVDPDESRDPLENGVGEGSHSEGARGPGHVHLPDHLTGYESPIDRLPFHVPLQIPNQDAANHERERDDGKKRQEDEGEVQFSRKAGCQTRDEVAPLDSNGCPHRG